MWIGLREDIEERFAQLEGVYDVQGEREGLSTFRPESSEAVVARVNDWRKRNREKRNASARAWGKANRDKTREALQRCRAKKKDAAAALT